MDNLNPATAFFIVRIFLGILFFIQGYDKMFNVHIKNVVKTFDPPLTSKHLPEFFILITAWFTSLIEFFGGFLLIIGFFTNYVLYLLGMDLILVAIGLGIIRPMWDMQFVFPRLLLLVSLLLMPEEWNVFACDYFFFSH